MLLIAEILRYIKERDYSFEFKGKSDVNIIGFAAFDQMKNHSISWIKKQSIWDKYEDDYREKGYLKDSLIVVQDGLDIDAPNQIITDSAKMLFFDILNYFWNRKEEFDGYKIGVNSVIGEGVKIANNVIIGNNCSITGEVSIGEGTVIEDNVVILGPAKIGKRCRIQPLVAIGIGGFGISEDAQGNRHMIHHFGGTVLGDDVFIGSHTNIEKGTLSDTIIGNDVKISPLCLIAHNANIEDSCVIIDSSLYGSSKIQENSYMVGSILKNQTTIGTNSLVGMGTVVTKDMPDHVVVVGAPARVIRDGHPGGLI